MTAIADQKITLTAEELLKLPRGKGERYELIEGELITIPSAGNLHGMVAGRISGEIYSYLREHKIGVVLAAETGFYTRGDKNTVRAADVTFISNEKIPEDGLPEGFSSIVPDLVVEVISKFDTAAEIEAKTQAWLDFGVLLVWVVYPKSGRVYVYRQGERSPGVLTNEDTLDGGDVLPSFSLALKTLFEK